MNKKTIKKIAAALILVLTAFVLFNVTYKVWIAKRLESVAKVLQESQQSEDIVYIGHNTQAKLEQLPVDVGIEVKIGDAFSPIGDRKADACILYSTKEKEILGLRMKYDRGRDKFHILGFWTP